MSAFKWALYAYSFDPENDPYGWQWRLTYLAIMAGANLTQLPSNMGPLAMLALAWSQLPSSTAALLTCLRTYTPLQDWCQGPLPAEWHVLLANLLHMTVALMKPRFQSGEMRKCWEATKGEAKKLGPLPLPPIPWSSYGESISRHCVLYDCSTAPFVITDSRARTLWRPFPLVVSPLSEGERQTARGGQSGTHSEAMRTSVVQSMLDRLRALNPFGTIEENHLAEEEN